MHGHEFDNYNIKLFNHKSSSIITKIKQTVFYCHVHKHIHEFKLINIMKLVA